MSDIIKNFVVIFVYVMYAAIFARVILSWLPIGRTDNPLTAIVYQITEPMLAPLRRLIPRIGLFDLTPMIALLILGAIQAVVERSI